jgi:hypothetical protein
MLTKHYKKQTDNLKKIEKSQRCLHTTPDFEMIPDW